MPAATRAPKAISRMTSVIGSESVSAFLKSSLNDFVELLRGARFAELADGEPGVGGLYGAYRRKRWTDAIFDLILGAGDLVAQQGRVAILRDLALVTG